MNGASLSASSPNVRLSSAGVYVLVTAAFGAGGDLTGVCFGIPDNTGGGAFTGVRLGVSTTGGGAFTTGCGVPEPTDPTTSHSPTHTAFHLS